MFLYLYSGTSFYGSVCVVSGVVGAGSLVAVLVAVFVTAGVPDTGVDVVMTVVAVGAAVSTGAGVAVNVGVSGNGVTVGGMSVGVEAGVLVGGIAVGVETGVLVGGSV